MAALTAAAKTRATTTVASLGRRPLTTSSTPPKVIFSGIQPSGTIHLGNLLGALDNWRRLSRDEPSSTAILYSVVGLHALTLPKDPGTLERERREMLASLLALGLGTGTTGTGTSPTATAAAGGATTGAGGGGGGGGGGGREILFCQDMVPEHTELAWILNCLTPMGKLQRMTTWKGKLAVAKTPGSDRGGIDVNSSDLNLGLFSYPVLQAADILLYKGTHVPVGEDQQQHLELARETARSFNHLFGGSSTSGRSRRPFFPEPQSLITPSKRILSLRNPNEKMSKSSPNRHGRIELTDSRETIVQKVRSAVTDSVHGVSFDPVARPGVSNLLTILAACRPTPTTPEEEAVRLADVSMAEFKAEVAEMVDGYLSPVRTELERLLGPDYLRDRATTGGKGTGVRMQEEGYLREVAERGARQARERAAGVLAEVKALVGLSRF